MALKIGAVSEGKDVSMTCKFSPGVVDSLKLYAEAYKLETGKEVEPKTLIPLMIESFLEGDRGFKKFLKGKAGNTEKTA